MPIPRERVISYKGQTLTLYPISILAERLSKALKEDRTTQTIRKWEGKGILPNAMFRIKKKRYYTDAQIKTICKIAKECEIRQGAPLALTNFSARCWEELREVNKQYM